MKTYDQTEIVSRARKHFDELLEQKIDHLHELTGIEKERFVKLNPMDFLLRMEGQYVKGHKYQGIGDYVAKTKTPDNFLISPIDEDVETANQICYKTGQVERKLRAHKCQVMPISNLAAKRFFIKNHRQTVPAMSAKAINFSLVFEGEVVAVMSYDYTQSAVRGLGKADMYELLRLSVKHGTQINGGASKLQAKCEEAIRHMGCTKIFSYSNATINQGNVYRQLGFEPGKVQDGQAWSVEPDFRMIRLVNCCKVSGFKGAKTTDLMERGAVKVSITANRTWIKDLQL